MGETGQLTMNRQFLTQLKETAGAAVAAASTLEALQALEVQYVGRKSELTAALRQLKDMTAAERQTLGGLANEVKQTIIEALARRRTELSHREQAPAIDVTLPGRVVKAGRLHPLSVMQYQLEDIFSSLGFRVLDGPELESEYFNFESLNVPATHPARDMQDTFFIDEPAPDQTNRLVMRTHTSPMQVRAMRQFGAPLRAVFPGRVYRFEATDARHETTFTQVEGLLIDRDISIAHLTAVIRSFLKEIFQRDIKLRLRPGYFPFVEPGFEVDLNCALCAGRGCPVCKQTGWVEFMGCGLVHPSVLRAGDLDPNEYSGFAFGFGLTRLVMMKYGIDDIRLLLSGDSRFLEQF